MRAAVYRRFGGPEVLEARDVHRSFRQGPVTLEVLRGINLRILQGERRWLPLALIYLAMGVGRLVFGTVGILLENDTLGAMTGGNVGLQLAVHPRSMVIAYSLGVVITFLAVILSSWRVSKLNVVAAIRDIPEVYRAKKHRSQLIWGTIGVLLGGLLFGIATFRAGVLPRWAGGVLAVGVETGRGEEIPTRRAGPRGGFTARGPSSTPSPLFERTDARRPSSSRSPRMQTC